MIIRSQDKKSTTTDLNLTIYEDDWTHKWEITNNLGMELGSYSTEEKAIKVLDMIEDAVRNIAFTDGVVFRMPQDSEV